MKNIFCSLSVFCSVLLFTNTALAQDNPTVQSEINYLKERLSVLEKEIKQERIDREFEKTLTRRKTKTHSPDDVIVRLRPAPSFQTRDGKTSFALDGRIMVDAGIVTKEKTSSLKHSTSLRRMWLGASGNVDEDWSYRALVGFEDNDTTVADAFIKYQGFDNTDILIGHFFENNGIEIGRANLINPFMERSSAIMTFRPLRRTGVSVNPYGKNWGAHFGVFGSNTNNASSDNKGNGFTGRAHIAMINNKEKSHYLHLGFNSSYRTPDSATRTTRFNTTGNARVINTTLIDSGDITNVDDYMQNMAEFHYQIGSFNITSEYIRTDLSRNGSQNIQFNGGYIMASYFLTGEAYQYDAQMGVPTAADVKKGTWEIASRYSVTDLNNKDISGGKLKSYDLGLSYYANPHLKLMANYIINRMDNNTVLQKRNPQYLMFRAQINF